MPSKNDVDFLMDTVRQWQASQDQEKERRISLAKAKARKTSEGTWRGKTWARPKHPLLEHPSSSGQKGSCPPPYKEDESSGWSNAPLFKEVNIIDSSNWSFDANYKENGPATNPTGTPFSVFRLPKMDLKQFDGDPKNWQDFIAIFRDLVHDNNSLTTTQKMAILKRLLTLEIQNGLGDSLSSPALYSQALKELESTYGHPSLISRTYFQSLIQLPRVNQNDYKSLLKFSQTVNGAVTSLKSGGYSHELQSSSLLDTTNHRQAAIRGTKQVGETNRQKATSLPQPSRFRSMPQQFC